MFLLNDLTYNGRNYFLIISENDTRIDWYIISKNNLDTKILIKRNWELIKPNILSARSSSIERQLDFGNFYLVEQIISTFENEKVKMSNSEKLELVSSDKSTKIIHKGEILTYSSVANTSDYKLKGSKCKQSLAEIKLNSSICKIQTLASQRVKSNLFCDSLAWFLEEDVLKSSNKQKEKILASKQKTLAQLRIEHDLSWALDNRGRLTKCYVVANREMLEELSRDVFPNIKYWAVDIETTGLKMYKGDNPDNFDRVVSLMVSWKEDQALFIPIDMEYMDNLKTDEWLPYMKPWLEKIPAIGHNIPFDGRGLYSEYGITMNLHCCTQILNFHLNTLRAKNHNSLKYLEHKYLNVDTLELKDIFGSKKLATLFRYIQNPTVALLYACPDVDYCLQLYKLLVQQLPASDYKAFNIDMRTAKTLMKMDSIGNAVNTNLAEKLREANNKDKDLLEDMIYRMLGKTILLKEKLTEITAGLTNGSLTDEDAKKELEEFQNSSQYNSVRYEFNLNSTQKLADALYNIMDIPVQGYSEKTGAPAVNGPILKKLMGIKLDTPEEHLKENILSKETEVIGKEVILIDKDKYNSLKYPIAFLITEFKLREKRDGTFYKKLLDTTIEGRCYDDSSLTRAETYRIINPSQVIQSYMKKMIVPYNNDYYHLIFDFSQIEYHVMAGECGQQELIVRLADPRADFHKECASILKHIEPWEVDGKTRKAMKSINFGIPYGLGVSSLCINLYGSINAENLMKTKIDLNNWKSTFPEIWNKLEETRDLALENGYVENAFHRRRYFYDPEVKTLEEWKEKRTKTEIAKVRRESGNFIIQSFAADLFKIALCNFRERLEKEGLAEYVKSTLTIHDEIVTSVHKSVNPFYLYKIIYETCMHKIKGHPPYFAGISIVNNWYEGKDSLYEAPIEFVEYIINSPLCKDKFLKEPIDDMKSYVYSVMKSYMTSVFD